MHLREISNVSNTEKEGGWKGLPDQLETHRGERCRCHRALERRSAGGSNSHSILLREDAQVVTALRNGKSRLVVVVGGQVPLRPNGVFVLTMLAAVVQDSSLSVR